MLLSILTAFTTLGGCAGNPNSANVSASGSENLFFGQITAIDGSNITIAVGRQPKPPQLNEQQSANATASATADNEQTGKPQGGAPPSGDTSLGDDNVPNGNPPNGSTSQGDDNAPNGTPPSDGNAPDNIGKGPVCITLTGEEQTIAVSNDTMITVQGGKDSLAGSLTDLKSGDIVTVVLKDGKVSSITVMKLNIPKGDNEPGPQSSDAASSNSTADNIDSTT